MIHITLGAILSGHIPNFDFLNANTNLTFGFQENVKIENNCITLSRPPVATYFPSELHFMATISPSCCFCRCKPIPPDVQNLIHPSIDPVTNWVPLGLIEIKIQTMNT